MASYDDIFGGLGLPPAAAADPAPPEAKPASTGKAAAATPAPTATTVVRAIPGKRQIIKKVVVTSAAAKPAWTQPISDSKDPATTASAASSSSSVNSLPAAASTPDGTAAPAQAGSKRGAPSGSNNNSKKRTGPRTVYDEPYDPTRPNDYTAYRQWRDEVRKTRPPPPPPPAAPVARPADPAPSSRVSTAPELEDAMNVDPPSRSTAPASRGSRASSVESSATSSSSSSSESEESDDEGIDIDGEPMDELDLKQIPGFLRLYVLGTVDPTILNQHLAVKVPTVHLAPQPLDAITASTVLVLENMVDARDVDEDLEAETSEECSKFGQVHKCHIHTFKNPPPGQAAVRIFVQFTHADAAQRAVAAMHGRFFGGREVSAKLYDETLFRLAKYEYLK
ncbi:Splicing factor 45 [Blastocladiella emersonii ATCC 22665]|nr:Splicing factor 45 [Blastocladiella emersonii ATCC 22665]